MMKRNRMPWQLGLVLAVLAAGCASAGSRDERGDPNVLTAAELQAVDGPDLHAVISRLRPRWLQARNQRTFTGGVTIGVIVDGVRDRGGVNVLYNIRPETVERVEFMNANDAQTRYGGDLQGGAILVTLKR